MSSVRSVVGLVGVAGGAGVVVFGLQQNDMFMLAGGVAFLVGGMFATFRKITCPDCGARAWVSSRKLTHCMACGVDWGKSADRNRST